MKKRLNVNSVEELFNIPDDIILQYDEIAIHKNPLWEMLKKNMKIPILQIECSETMKEKKK